MLKTPTQTMSEGVPEQGEGPGPADDVGAESLGQHLRHHGEQPEQADRDVQAVVSRRG